MGEERPAMSHGGNDSPNKGKAESSRSDSSKAEST